MPDNQSSVVPQTLVRYYQDGDAWCVVTKRFQDLQTTPEDVYWCDSEEEAKALVRFVHKAVEPLLTVCNRLIEEGRDALAGAPEIPWSRQDYERTGYLAAMSRVAKELAMATGQQSGQKGEAAD